LHIAKITVSGVLALNEFREIFSVIDVLKRSLHLIQQSVVIFLDELGLKEAALNAAVPRDEAGIFKQ
jgi:hypothetical protein